MCLNYVQSNEQQLKHNFILKWQYLSNTAIWYVQYFSNNISWLRNTELFLPNFQKQEVL